MDMDPRDIKLSSGGRSIVSFSHPPPLHPCLSVAASAKRLNAVVDSLTLLLRILEVLVSNLDQETGYSESIVK
jgi:hypothetical protein